MANKEKFEKIYDELKQETSEISEEINELVKELTKRNKIANSIALIISIVTDIIIFKRILLMFEASIIPTIFALLMIDLIIFVVINIILEKPIAKKEEYKNKFKEIVISKLINNFYEVDKYLPNEEMPENIYKQGNYEMWDEYYSDDYIEGKVDGKYNMKMAEVLTQTIEREKDKDGNEEERVVVLFHGLFSQIMLDKSINSELRIIPSINSNMYKNRLKMDSRRIRKKLQCLYNK